jgi:hypothetical protein
VKEQIESFLVRYADPRYLKWLLLLAGLIALVLGAGAPDAPAGGGSGG